jgi:hypothetical protein
MEVANVEVMELEPEEVEEMPSSCLAGGPRKRKSRPKLFEVAVIDMSVG